MAAAPASARRAGRRPSPGPAPRGSGSAATAASGSGASSRSGTSPNRSANAWRPSTGGMRRLGARDRAQRRTGGRPLAVSAAHLAADPGAGAGCAGHVRAGAAHHDADRRPGQQHDADQYAKRDDDRDADRPDQAVQGRCAAYVPISPPWGSAAACRWSRARARASPGTPSRPGRSGRRRGAGCEEDRSADPDQNRRHDASARPITSCSSVSILRADHAAVPVQVLDEAEEDAERDQPAADQVVRCWSEERLGARFRWGVRADGGRAGAESSA